MDGPWTLTELTAVAAELISSDQPAQSSGRVRDLPNERLIRWYVTIGLVDPPVGRRGRVALYGRRHLLQLVAVKRRQAAGRTLTEIQQELTGATDDMLEAIADRHRGPDHPPAAFWTPAHRARVRDGRSGTTDATDATDAERTAEPVRGAQPIREAQPVRGARLAPGVTLLLDGDELSPADLVAIAAASAPLIETLAARGLIPAERSEP